MFECPVKSSDSELEIENQIPNGQNPKELHNNRYQIPNMVLLNADLRLYHFTQQTRIDQLIPKSRKFLQYKSIA